MRNYDVGEAPFEAPWGGGRQTRWDSFASTIQADRLEFNPSLKLLTGRAVKKAFYDLIKSTSTEWAETSGIEEDYEEMRRNLYDLRNRVAKAERAFDDPEAESQAAEAAEADADKENASQDSASWAEKEKQQQLQRNGHREKV
jgi:hypothetical protein